VLWFHGYAMSSRVWEELWALLPGWRHVGIDLPGHGASRPVSTGEDLRSLARTIGEIAAEQDVRHLVALSFGTLVALQVAIQYPRSFASVVLAAPALAGGPHDPEIEVRYEQLAHLYHAYGAGPHLAALWMRSPPDTFKGAERRPILWQRLFSLAAAHSWAELEVGSMLSLTGPPQSRRELRRVQAAVLVVVGEHELPTFRTCGELLLDWLPACAWTELPDAGHLCLLEAPGEAASLLASQLRSRGAPRGQRLTRSSRRPAR
jgi:2-succinyl-6-hydroxy-2,4-cyclohexadiene-1-carboxylate synthase